MDVFGFDGSVTEWPGCVGVIICWSLWIFFRLPSVQLCGCALFVANLNYYSISSNVLPLLDTLVVD